MKKFLIVTCFLILSLPSLCFASDDSWYDVGRSIGSSIGSSMTVGSDDKVFHQDEYYDFTKVKTILINAQIASGFEQYISDPYIATQYCSIIKNDLGDKFVIRTVPEVIKAYIKNVQPALSGQTPAEQEEIFKKYFQKILADSDIMIDSLIYCYNQNGGSGNVYIDFTVKSKGDVVMYYKDMRLDAPRSSKDGMANRISRAFAKKFVSATSKSN